MALQPGDRIDRYVIDAPLGAGGMGEVYRAHDGKLQRSVALKVLRPSALTELEGSAGRGAAMILREARAAAALEHPNVVAVYDVGQVEAPGDLHGTTYLAMELVKGSTLRALHRQGTAPIGERIRWLTDVARGLGAAHAAGLVHRDIKPDNVMIRDDGLVKVLDFGIAKRSLKAAVDPTSSTEGLSAALTTEATTGGPNVIGTPQYMAPEQLRGETLDGRADQFSWGVMAYEILSGAPPWSTDGGAIALVSQILSHEPPTLMGVASLPPWVASAVARAMSKDRTQRFPTMEALITALGGPADPNGETQPRFQPSLPPSTPRALSPPPSVAAPDRRGSSRALIALGGLLAVAAITTPFARAKLRAMHAASSTSAVVAAPVGCTSNVACAADHHGQPYVCRAADRQCVAVGSEDCTPYFEPRDLTHDDTVWLGAMFPLHGPEATAYGQMHMNAAMMARKEIAQATSALDGEGASQRVRRIAMVGCDDSVDGMRAAHHLAADVGVPAILGFKNGQEVVDIAGGYLIKKGVLTVASITSSPLITKLPQPGGQPRLVWRSFFSMEGVAKATAAITDRVFEPRLRLGTAPMRFMLVRADTTASRSLAEALFRTLRFNGKSAVENGTDYEELSVRATMLGPGEIDALVDRIRQFHPSLIVINLEPDDVGVLVKAVETALSTSSERRPTWVVANGATESLDGVIGTSAERRHRMFALLSTSDSAANARFVIRYNDANATPVSRAVSPASTYDAAYLLAYAVFANDRGAMTGATLSKAIERLQPPGLKVEVGTEGLLPGLQALANGRAIDLHGALTAMDFDLATGEVFVDFTLRCPAIDPAGAAQGEVDSGVVYRAATGGVEGTDHCP